MIMGKNCKNLDERQLLQRGNVFQHIVVLLLILLAADGFLADKGIVWAEGMWKNILIIWTALTLGFCEFIIQEISPRGSRMGILYAMLGVAGALIIILDLFRIAAGREFPSNGLMLTHCGASLIEGGLMISIFLTFLGKKLYNHWKETREEEE